MEDIGDWRKIIREVMAESRKSPDPIIDRLSRLGVPVFKENFDQTEFWKTVHKALEMNGYVIRDLASPENSGDIERNIRLARMIKSTGS